MAVEPRLLNPTKATIAQKNETKTQYDHLRRTPINVVAKDVSFDIDCQVKWNTQIGDFANPDIKQEGADEREMGYIMVRTKDLNALSKVLRRGDRILKLGNQDVLFFILRVDFGSHYGGEFKLLRVSFGDRLGQNG